MSFLSASLALIGIAAFLLILIPVGVTFYIRKRKRVESDYLRYDIESLGVTLKEYKLASRNRRNFLVEQQRYRARSSEDENCQPSESALRSC